MRETTGGEFGERVKQTMREKKSSLEVVVALMPRTGGGATEVIEWKFFCLCGGYYVVFSPPFPLALHGLLRFRHGFWTSQFRNSKRQPKNKELLRKVRKANEQNEKTEPSFLGMCESAVLTSPGILN